MCFQEQRIEVCCVVQEHRPSNRKARDTGVGNDSLNRIRRV